MARRSLIGLLTGVIALLLSGAPRATATADDSCPYADAAPGSVSVQSYEDGVLCLLNQQRSQHGLDPLRDDPKLAKAALGHSASMRSRGYFAHTARGGQSLPGRIRDTHYLGNSPRWLVGENLGWGRSPIGTPRTLTAAWMASPSHRENMLERRFEDVGIGTVWGTPFNPDEPAGATITLDFGGRFGG